MVRRRLALLVAVALLLIAPASASAFSGEQATRVVGRTPAVQEQARKHGALRASAALQPGTTKWEVHVFAGKTEVARAFVDDRSGKLVGKVFTGKALLGPSARGGVGSTFRARVNWTTVALCVLFLLPFLDPRRPFRMLHLDLLAFLGFEVSFLLIQNEHLVASVWVQYVPLLYLLGRFAWLGLRGPGNHDDGPLVPYASDRLLAGGLVALVVGRLVFNVVWSAVGDVGYAGLFGADGLTHGYDLYGDSAAHLDAYGPVNYFFYVPFVLLFPLGPGFSHTNVEGAHLASITLDLAVIVLLMLVGRRLLSGREGRRLGLALGYAWAAYPLAFFPLAVNSNDGIVSVVVLGALLAYASPIGRAVVLGLGAAAKFSPLGLVPVFALGRERSSRNAALVFGLAVAIFALAFSPYISQSGLETVWNSTIGFQLNRDDPFSLWTTYPSLHPLQVVVQALAVAFVALVSWFPRERSVPVIAALSAAVMIALQTAGGYWAHTYIVWFAAPGFVALFALQLRRPLRTGQAAARQSSVG